MMIKRNIAAFLCLVMCLTSLIVPTWAVGERDITDHETCAIILKQLGLFKGVSDTDFDLDRAPTRIEALVMLIRVLGKEKEALDGTWRHPFEDVPSWADPYVGYAYVNGLTNGVSPTEFGEGDASAANYLTFMLRALGYSDVNGLDFTWDNPFALSESAGILHESVDVKNFWRADVAAVSFLALSANLKGSANTLADKLISAGVFTLEEYGAAMNMDFSDVTTPVTPPEPVTPPTPETEPTPETPPTPVTPPADGKLNAEQISEKCAPAVFYVEVYGYNGAIRASGSGFFISADGYAITNFHVAENSSYLVVTTTDGKKYDSVTVVDIDRENDIALLKVRSSDKFHYLEVGDSDAVKQGQTVYAIGSPRGLENTLSQGLVSNPRRTIDEQVYIQTSAQIDSGSSGGALINDYGKVIGVTSAAVKNNTADLNLAIPINKIKGLDKNNPRDIVLWNVNNYTPEDAINNFGYITGINLLSTKALPRGYELIYDATDVAVSKKDSDPLNTCLEVYKQILKASGFTVTVVDRYTTKYSLPYAADSGTITVALDKNKQYIFVSVEVDAEYYKKAPKVPDFGWYSGLAEDKYTSSGETHTYRYKYISTYTLAQAKSMLRMYMDVLEEAGFKYAGDSTMADGRDAEAFVGNGLRVKCRLEDQEYIYIEISPATVTPQISPTTRLIENLKVKGTHDAKNGTYKVSKKISKVLYDITYFEKTGIVQFSSAETVSVKNLDLTGVDINIDTNGMNLSNVTVEVTWETYIYLNANGSSSVVFICKMGDREFRYEADFNRSQFSEKTVLSQKKYIGPVKMRDMMQTSAVSQMVRTLKGCGAHLLNNLGVTLPELGFKDFLK